MAFEIRRLSEADLNKPARLCPVYDQGGNPYPGVAIMVVSIDSERYREAERRVKQLRLDRLSGRGGRANATEIDKEAFDMLVECTVDWEGFLEDGQALTCTAENVAKVYTVAPWIKEQVSVFMGDRRNFSSASSNGSAPPSK